MPSSKTNLETLIDDLERAQVTFNRVKAPYWLDLGNIRNQLSTALDFVKALDRMGSYDQQKMCADLTSNGEEDN